MKRTLLQTTSVLGVVLMVLGLFALSVTVAEAKNGNNPNPKANNSNNKVTICHIPPGNPANAHTITISENAAPAHIHNHSDTMGPCPNTPPPPAMSCEDALASGLLTGSVSADGTATVTNNADDAYTVSLAAYAMMSGTVSDQELYDVDATVVSAHSSESLSVSMPVCATQLDLVCGTALQTNPEYGNRVIDYEHVNLGNWCTPTATGNVAVAVAPYYPQEHDFVFTCTAPDMTPTSYSWYFGDNEHLLNTNMNNVLHTYTDAGSYTVACWVTDGTDVAVGTLDVTVA
jgi:PKD repeat protein